MNAVFIIPVVNWWYLITITIKCYDCAKNVAASENQF
jgi:hypothetical protein